MKYRAVWKVGGHPRRSMGSMKPRRRQIQSLKPKGTILMKGVASLGTDWKKAA